MVFAVDLDENLIDVEGVAVSSVSSFQTPGIFASELNAPETDGFSADDDSSFGQ